jgi:hypothetical protein
MLCLWAFEGTLVARDGPVLSMWQTLFALEGRNVLLTEGPAEDAQAWLSAHEDSDIAPAVARVDRVVAVPPGEEPAPMRWAAEVDALLEGDGVAIVFDHRPEYLAAVLHRCPTVKVFEVRLEDAVARLDGNG